MLGYRLKFPDFKLRKLRNSPKILFWVGLFWLEDYTEKLRKLIPAPSFR